MFLDRNDRDMAANFSLRSLRNRTFDTTQNRTTTIPVGCPTAVCNPTAEAATNRLVGYQFDNAGNTKVDAESRAFVYDGENKQVEVRDAANGIIGQYFYDGDGKRVKKVVPTGETTVFAYDASGKLVAEYSTVVEPQQTAKTSYLTNDHLGSPRITTDSVGQVISRRDFMPFGEEVVRSNYGSDSVRQKFTGYERDIETELNFAQARYQNSNHGRFTSPDVLGGHIGNPQTFNRYSYVMNNPLNLVDPSGYCGTTAGSPDNTPCLWYRNGNGNYMSVSQQQFGDGSGYAGYTLVEDREAVYFQLTTLNGDYANDAEYQALVKNNSFVGLGANGRFVGLPGDPVAVGPEEEDPFSNRLLHGACEEEGGSCGEQLFNQDILADSVELSAGFLGLGGAGKVTRNGDILGGVNANVADSIANPMQMVKAMKGRVLPTASLMFNKTLRFGRISRDQRVNIEGGTSFGIGGGYIIGGQILYVPSTGDVVVGGGLTTPGINFGGSYLKPIDTVPAGW